MKVNLMITSGSRAYGTNTDSSDYDTAGIYTPSLDVVFPHLSRKIIGFVPHCTEVPKVVTTETVIGGIKHESTIFPIVKFINGLLSGTPNCTEWLFIPDKHIKLIDSVGKYLRDNRETFITKLLLKNIINYAAGQYHKAIPAAALEIRKFEIEHDIPHDVSYTDIEEESQHSKTHLSHLTDEELLQYRKLFKNSKRFYDNKKNGFDIKAAYHAQRLSYYCSNLLLYNDMRMGDKHQTDYLLAIRRGEISLTELDTNLNLPQLQEIEQSSFPAKLSDQIAERVLFDCLELNFGKLPSGY